MLAKQLKYLAQNRASNLKLFGPVDGIGSQNILWNEFWLH